MAKAELVMSSVVHTSFHPETQISSQAQAEHFADVLWGHMQGSGSPALGRFSLSPVVMIIVLLKGVDIWTRPLASPPLDLCKHASPSWHTVYS